jgi:hypothetical protein
MSLEYIVGEAIINTLACVGALNSVFIKQRINTELEQLKEDELEEIKKNKKSK